MVLELAKSVNFSMVFWISTVPWIFPTIEGSNTLDKSNSLGNDKWGGFSYERREIADFIQNLHIPLIMICGDSHMISFDDGRNNLYHSGQGLGFPVFHSASMGRLQLLGPEIF
jgi:phosphodiesterase/alkaline phosphatase D-like protein